MRYLVDMSEDEKMMEAVLWDARLSDDQRADIVARFGEKIGPVRFVLEAKKILGKSQTLHGRV